MKLKDACSLERKLDKPKQCIKKQRHHFTDKGWDSQSYGFSSSRVHVRGIAPPAICVADYRLALQCGDCLMEFISCAYCGKNASVRLRNRRYHRSDRSREEKNCQKDA